MDSTELNHRRTDALPVLDRIVARLDEITERMVQHYLSEVPSYAELDPSVVERDVRLVSRRNLEIFLSEVRERREPTDEELDLLRKGAERRVDQGIPLADLLHAYRSGTRIAWYAVLEELESGSREERESGGYLAAALLDHLDRVSTAVEGAYLSKWHAHIHRSAMHRWDLAGELLHEPDQTRTRLLAREAGIVIPDDLVLVALPAGRRIEPSSEAGLPGFLTEYQGRSILFLDADVGNEDLNRIADDAGAPVGVSEERPWIMGMGPALTEACRVADLAMQLGAKGALSGGDLLMERMLVAEPEVAERLYQQTFDKLDRGDPSGILKGTVEAYLEAGNSLVGAGARLHVHPNTVAYRLERAREVGDIDLTTPDARLKAHLALRARRLSGGADGATP